MALSRFLRWTLEELRAQFQPLDLLCFAQTMKGEAERSRWSSFLCENTSSFNVGRI